MPVLVTPPRPCKGDVPVSRSPCSLGDMAVEILHFKDDSSLDTFGDFCEWDPWEIPPEEFTVEGSRIGSGITAEVFRGVWRGTAVAVKQIKLAGPRLNPKIVEAFKRELTVRLLSEFCEGGTLFDLVHNSPKLVLSWKQRMKILSDVAKGMNYLHACNPRIFHRDLKSLNILVSEKVGDEFDTPILKIADFGMAKIRAAGGNLMTANAGTYHWMAPEVLGGQSYTEKVDIYSFGIVMYEVVTRRVPFEETGLNPIQVAISVSKGSRPALEFVPPECPEPILTLMQACWDQVPENRPSMEQVIQVLKSVTVPSRNTPQLLCKDTQFYNSPKRYI